MVEMMQRTRTQAGGPQMLVSQTGSSTQSRSCPAMMSQAVREAWMCPSCDNSVLPGTPFDTTSFRAG